MSDKELSGRELSEAVARRVMNQMPCDGWVRMNFGSAGGAALRKECAHEKETCYPTAKFGNVHGSYDGVPPYAAKIESAMMVVEKMRERDWYVEIANMSTGWFVNFIYDINERIDCPAQARLLPEAICRAALATIENNK